MPKRAQRLVFTASAPFSYALWLAGGFDGLDGLNGWLWRVCGGENATGVHGNGFGSWMVGWMVGWVVSWMVSWMVSFPPLVGHKKRLF